LTVGFETLTSGQSGRIVADTIAAIVVLPRSSLDLLSREAVRFGPGH
jgi:hypothetical protein